jgi:hypothetical protein
LESVTFVQGIVETPIFCIPQKTTLEQIRKVFLQWIENHPKDLHETSFYGFTSSLIEAFPCPQSNRQSGFSSYVFVSKESLSNQKLTEICKYSSDNPVEPFGKGFRGSKCIGFLMGSLVTREFEYRSYSQQ